MLAIGFLHVARSWVYLCLLTHFSITNNTIANHFPAPSTTKIDAIVSKLADTEDDTEQQVEEW